MNLMLMVLLEQQHMRLKLTDLPIGVNEESTYARNRILKVKDDGTGYELIDPNELQTYGLRSFWSK